MNEEMKKEAHDLFGKIITWSYDIQDVSARRAIVRLAKKGMRLIEGKEDNPMFEINEPYIPSKEKE